MRKKGKKRNLFGKHYISLRYASTPKPCCKAAFSKGSSLNHPSVALPRGSSALKAEDIRKTPTPHRNIFHNEKRLILFLNVEENVLNDSQFLKRRHGIVRDLLPWIRETESI